MYLERKFARKRKRPESESTPSDVKKTPKDTPKLSRGLQKETPKDTPKARQGAKEGVSIGPEYVPHASFIPHASVCNLKTLPFRTFLQRS